MSEAWRDALAAAAIFAAAPHALAAVVVRGAPGPIRDAWLAALSAQLPDGAPVRRIPAHVTDDRLLGGLDLAATLATGSPVLARGLLAECDGGVAIVPMAERMGAGLASRIAAALDTGEVAVEREGFTRRAPARLGVVLLDERVGDDERVPAALQERAAMTLDLTGVSLRDVEEAVPPQGARGATARSDDVQAHALCAAALALGVDSLRAPLFALRVARIAAGLAGRAVVDDDDLALAARLVLAPRATRLPPQDDEPEPPPDPDTPPEQQAQDDRPLEDRVLDAAEAVLPAGLLEQLALGQHAARVRAAGRAGALHQARARGRRIGHRPGDPAHGARLDLVATLRAAAPWQRVRARAPDARVAVRRDDFRIVRFAQRTHTTTVFVVDASGSSALQRLAEAKGAVQLLLAECYVRRDSVALVAFRNAGAEILLPPTRSLARAKRLLASLPGGGGTPLAAGIDAGVALALATRARGNDPLCVVLTDGRANVGRDGVGGRTRAGEEALAAARAARAQAIPALVVDISAQPADAARKLAEAMGARYLPLPHAHAQTITRAVRALAA
ncbi:MAG: magnesium chelatase subunit D [Burkholderiales bacterium]